jgi:hypothetical protein
LGKRKEGSYFQEQVFGFLKSSILPDSRILVVGCPSVEFLDSLQPSYGVGLVQEGKNLNMAKPTNSQIKMENINFNSFNTTTSFEYVIFCDYMTYEDDLHNVFLKMHKIITPETKVFIIGVNPNMFLTLRIAKAVGFHTPKIERNILKLKDIENLASLFGYNKLDRGYRFFIPFSFCGMFFPLVNSILARIPVIRHLSFGHFVVLQQSRHPLTFQELSCSVVVPCFNEEENVRECLQRIPDFGLWREIVVVDDGSQDDTAEIVRELMEGREDIRLISYEKNKGKGYAMREGWQASKGDILMMLDCDMTTPPEELPLFYDAIKMGAEFVNGTRIVYPRERKSIPGVNRIGVAFFAALMSWVIQRRITDTFCGTKVFLKKYWEHFAIEELLWGDWDLFFMAARFRTKMVEVPVHYRTRKAGEAKMRPFKHGIRLLRYAMKGLWIVK